MTLCDIMIHRDHYFFVHRVMKLINHIVFKENWVWNGISAAASRMTHLFTASLCRPSHSHCGRMQLCLFHDKLSRCEWKGAYNISCHQMQLLLRTPLPPFFSLPCQCLMALQLAFKSCCVLVFTPQTFLFFFLLPQHCISLCFFCHSTLLGEHN